MITNEEVVYTNNNTIITITHYDTGEIVMVETPINND
jgi:hypothetical protein